MRVSSVLAVLAFVAIPAGSPARAQDPVEAAQAVISDQIDAFRRNDAAAAYSHASPEIRSVFPNAEIFMGMVKQSYAPVFRQSNYAFGRNRALDNGERVFQEVLISGTDGNSWAAFYDLLRQRDGRYAINGVRVARDLVNQGL